MSLGFLVALALAEAPPSAGALASVGDALGDTVVVAVEVHPEYERYSLRFEDGRVAVAEMTGGAGGLCDVNGLTLFPRADLSGVNETVGMAELCARMEARSPRLRPRIGPEGGESGDVRAAGGAPREGAPPSVEPTSGARTASHAEATGATRLTPIHLLLGLLAAFGLPLLRVDRRLVGVTAAALAARLWASPVGVGNGNLAGYEKLLLARGTLAAPPYGEGWGSLMGFVPGWPGGVFAANLVLAVLAAPLLAALVRRQAGERAGLAAGLLFALLPTHIGVSATETMHVPVLTFELLSVLAAGAFARAETLRTSVAPGLVAALAAGMAVHLRPDAIPFIGVCVAWALLGGKGLRGGSLGRLVLPALVLGGVVGWRLATLGAGGGDLLRLPDLHVLLPRLGAPTAEGAFQLFWHAGFTPPVTWGLVAVGAATLARGRRWSLLGLLLAWAVGTTLPFSTKVWPLVDAVRLQLTGQAPWIALAGIGAAALPRWVLPVALLAMLPYLPVRPWVQTEEWQFLAKEVPALPADTTIRYGGRAQRSGAFAAVMERLGPARWTTAPADYVYVGLECLAEGACDTSGCVMATHTELMGRADLDLVLPTRTIGFYRCPDASAPAVPSSEAP